MLYGHVTSSFKELQMIPKFYTNLFLSMAKSKTVNQPLIIISLVSFILKS